ncbi:hypothetical protein AB1N83_004604 [Pleurotus pulmonarius]
MGEHFNQRLAQRFHMILPSDPTVIISGPDRALRHAYTKMSISDMVSFQHRQMLGGMLAPHGRIANSLWHGGSGIPLKLVFHSSD